MDKICNIVFCNKPSIWKAIPKDKRDLSHYYCSGCKTIQENISHTWEKFVKIKKP
jgi:4'-phosphopantetheinyl transferase EntD